ncbi:MAG: DUF3300 domain-containing protein [Acidobacteriaceae bacterium]|nr:DUF3300 domain-containing protein [Acidobacteriaceae bacterium]
MRTNKVFAMIAGAIFVAGFAVAPALAQAPDAPQGQYPQEQQQPPPPGQYPQAQGQAPQQGQYPQEGQYPAAQGQYPPPAQGQYPQQGQYPPAQGQYPPQGPAPGQYPAGQYPPGPQQGQYPAPPMLPPQQLDQLVQPIALYPDGLLAQVLTAATYSNEIPEAAGWANQHSFLHGDQLAHAIQEDNLPWDQSVIALLPFPRVLNYMAQYMGWTQALGNAALAQRGDVMDAVQRMRQEAYNYGYLRSNQYDRVEDMGPNDIEIQPVSPGYYYVPYYDPYVVFAAPRPGFFVGGAIRFGPGIVIGAGFAPWGWGHVGFEWRTHGVLIDGRPWGRTWVNRGAYVHPYAVPRARYEGPRVEHHEVRPAPERREGRPAPEHHEHL